MISLAIISRLYCPAMEPGCTQMTLNPSAFFIGTLVLVLVSGSATAFLQGALFGLAGSLPFRYTQALMSGQVRAGIRSYGPRVYLAFPPTIPCSAPLGLGVL